MNISSTSHSITLDWENADPLPDGYTVMYRASQQKGDFTFKGVHVSKIILNSLKSNTTFDIIVRSYNNKEEKVLFKVQHKTEKSAADELLDKSTKISNDPAIFQLPVNVTSCSSGVKCLELDLDSCTSEVCNEKTIVLLGDRKSGKTTLVDSMVNYIADVSCVDNYKLKLTQQDEDEDVLVHHYRIRGHVSFKIHYQLNIIDFQKLHYETGNEMRNMSINSFLKLLNDIGLKTIDVICCVFKISDKLECDAKIISDFIFKYFPHKQIIPMITFDDAEFGNVEIIEEIKKAYSLDENNVFCRFNNSDFLTSNGDTNQWKGRNENFEKFFKRLSVVQPLPIPIKKESSTRLIRCFGLVVGIAMLITIFWDVCILLPMNICAR